MASIPSNGYAAVMAGTNVYTGSNFFGSDCPKTPIVPTDPDDLVNKAYVTSVIPPIPPTPPVTEFSYTNTSNAVVPVALPTAAGQKLNLLASGLNGGLWSQIGLPQGGLGNITAFTQASDGSYWFGTNAGNTCYILRTDATLTTGLGLAGAMFTILPQNDPIINCFFEYGGFMFLGGRFDTLISFQPGGGINVENYNIGRYNLPFTGFPNANQLSGAGSGGAGGPYMGVGGTVNTIFMFEYVTGAGSPILILGGQFQNTLPTAWSGPNNNLNNLITMTGGLVGTGSQFWLNGNGGFAVIGGVVNTIFGVIDDFAEVYVGGSFTDVGPPPYTNIPYLMKMNFLSGTLSPGGKAQPIPNLNGAITDMCLSSLYGGRMLITGGFDLSPFGGSTVTSYFQFNTSTGQVFPAVSNFPAGSTGGKVFSTGGTDSVLFGTSNVVAWQNVAGTYWNKTVANAFAGTPLNSFRQQIGGGGGPNFFATYSSVGNLQKYTSGTLPAVATFQLPSARFRSATAPNNQYQNAVFSTAAGAQVFLSGAELYWSPAGALTTGLTFS